MTLPIAVREDLIQICMKANNRQEGAGRSTLFIKTGMLKGTGELYVNGEKVAEGAIEKTIPGGFSLSETFDVGVDNGTPVSNNYKKKDHFPFTGQIDKVTINLTGEDTDKAEETYQSRGRLMPAS
jgi:hypothetical protein